jgi:hypothetical protein
MERLVERFDFEAAGRRLRFGMVGSLGIGHRREGARRL